MAQKVSNFTPADELDGTELVPVIQGGANRRTTVQDVANKANAVAIIDDAVPAFDKVFSSEKTNSLVNAEATARASADSNLQTQIDSKLNAADYNDRFKGKYTTLTALQSAFPTANAGDYAQVDAGTGSNVINYNWDEQEGWVQGSSVGPSISSTDDLTEGSTNLYFTASRAQAAFSGTANRISITAGVIDIASTYVGQNSITTLGTIGTGTWQGTTIASGYGGTGFSFYAKGDLIYASAANVLSKLAVGTDGYVLTLVSGLPVWAAASGGGGTGIYAGTGAAFTSYAEGDLIYASAANVLSKLAADTEGKVLTMISGVPAWSASGVSWSRTGNAGTVAGTDFIGTTDDVDFMIKRNNIQTALFKGSTITVGINAGFGSSSTNSFFFGQAAGQNFSGNSANCFGYNAGSGASAANSNFFGFSAGASSVSSSGSNFFGFRAGNNAHAMNANFFGFCSGYNASSNYSNFFGYGVGAGIGAPSITGALFNITGSNNILMGTFITTPSASSSNMFSFGNVLYGFNCYSGTTQSKDAQTTGKISVGTNAPDASAILDLTSTTMGLLPPRMSTSDAASIPTKAEALFLYDSTLHKYKFWNGSAFEVISSS